MGALEFAPRETSNATILKVTERTAMLPPPNIQPGKYSLNAICIDRETQEIEPVVIPELTITIDPNAKTLPAPELDLVTQLREIAKIKQFSFKLFKEIIGVVNLFSVIIYVN